jgi:hypothetical protein
MKQIKRTQSMLWLLPTILLLEGCAGWNSAPARLQADYGASVRNMINNQIYDAAKTQSPDALAPDGMEGYKGDTILDKAYRRDVGKPSDVSHSQLGTSGGSNSGLSK